MSVAPSYHYCPDLYIPGENFLVRWSEKSRERSVVADYLKLPEVARRLDVSEKTARRMVKSGSLPAVFIGGAYRISEEDLEEYLENAKVAPGKAEAPSSQRSLFNGGEEERRELKPPEPPEAERIHNLRSWAAFFNGFSKRWSEETQGHLASGRIPFNWGLEKQCAALQLLRSALEEPSIGGRDDIEPELSQEEQQAKLELSRATDELFRVANKAYEAQRSLGKNAGGIPDSMIASQRRHLAALRNTA